MHPIQTVASPFARFTRAVAAAFLGAAALVAGAIPAAAQQADPVKLLVELPPDVKQLDCGETVDFQVVGEAANKTRVGFPGKTVELSATYGAVEVIKQPYQFRYRTPATLPDFTNVRIRAWLKENPDIVGETTVLVIPPAPFKRLVLQGAGSTPAGALLDIYLTGERPDGQMGDVPADAVTLRVEGAGKISHVRGNRYRFETPDNATGTSKIVATLTKYAKVTTTHEVLITGGAGGAQTPPASGGGSGGSGSGGGQTPPASGGTGGATPPSSGGSSGGQVPPPPAGGGSDKPGDKPSKPGADDDEPEGVVWKNGALRVNGWRTRAAKDADWGPMAKKLPAAGEPFETVNDGHWIRMKTTRADVVKVEAQEWGGGEKKDGKVSVLEPSKDGRFRLAYDNKTKLYRIGYDIVIPDEFRQWNLAILLTLSDGKVIREEFVFKNKVPAKK